MTKYNFEISNEAYASEINRLTNQLWKLIPMRENDEDWSTQLETVIIEICGLSKVIQKEDRYLCLLSKLEGLRSVDEFIIYRKTIFETISLLREIGAYGK